MTSQPSSSIPSANSRLALEDAYWAAHPGACLAGIDEAGRGCLAGPVVAGCITLSSELLHALAETTLARANDSKKLTAKVREELFTTLTTTPGIRWAIGQASAAEIDEINILRATHLAMRRAYEALGAPAPDETFIDGLPIKNFPAHFTAYVQGDARSLLIGCASILAKVTRDHALIALDKAYPHYGFAKHKAYGTRAHLEAIRTYGPCPEHRMTFAPLQPDLFTSDADTRK